MKKNEETHDKIMVVVNYYDDDKTGKRHYDIEGMHDTFNRSLARIIVQHMQKGVVVNEAYKPINK